MHKYTLDLSACVCVCSFILLPVRQPLQPWMHSDRKEWQWCKLATTFLSFHDPHTLIPMCGNTPRANKAAVYWKQENTCTLRMMTDIIRCHKHLFSNRHRCINSLAFLCMQKKKKTYWYIGIYSRTQWLSALKGPIPLRPPQEATPSITVSVNIVSPHLPIGSLCFGLPHLCF